MNVLPVLFVHGENFTYLSQTKSVRVLDDRDILIWIVIFWKNSFSFVD